MYSFFPLESQIKIGVNSSFHGIWNTTAAGNSLPATAGYSSGQYYPNHQPRNLFDGNWTSGLCSYGVCNISVFQVPCGANTGVFVTLISGPFILTAFRIVNGRYGSVRDPMKMTIEGSNQSGAALTLVSSWTLLYNGTTGLDIAGAINTAGIQQRLDNNQRSFDSYRFLVTQKRGADTCVEYSEIELYGY